MIPLLEMLKWGEFEKVDGPKHEWLENPHTGKTRHVVCQNDMQLFDCGTPGGPTYELDRSRDIAQAAMNSKPTPAKSNMRPTMTGIVTAIRCGLDPVALHMGAAPLCLDAVERVMSMCWERDGRPTVLLVGPGTLNASSLPSADDDRAGPPTRSWASYSIVTKFGILDVLPCIFVPGDSAVLVDPAKVRLVSDGKDPVSVTIEMHNAGDGGHAIIAGIAKP